MAIRIADTPQLPLNYTEYSQQLNSFLQQTIDLLAQNGGQNQVDLSEVKNTLAVFASAANSPNAANNKFLAERLFLGSGLPRRPWYRHVIQAPGMQSKYHRNLIFLLQGLYTGYGADSFPGVKQAIRDRNWPVAQQQVKLFLLLLCLCYYYYQFLLKHR